MADVIPWKKTRSKTVRSEKIWIDRCEDENQKRNDVAK